MSKAIECRFGADLLERIPKRAWAEGELDDITLHFTARSLPDELSQLRECNQTLEGTYRLCFGLDAAESHLEGRVSASRCFGGEWISLTIRIKSRESSKSSGGALNEAPPQKYRLQKPKFGRYLIQTDTNCRIIWDEIRKSLRNESPQGVIVVSAGTDSGKSTIAQGLALNQILALAEAQAWPHLVTFEEPIEEWKIQKHLNTSSNPPAYEEVKFMSPLAAHAWGFFFTPRQWKDDVSSLRKAVKDALRQSPKCFYVGEVRDDNDWRQVMFLAGTGHLVVTTTHGGSTVETLNRIFTALKARTPADRAMIASRILSVVNLQRFELGGAPGAKGAISAIVPHIWVRNSNSLNGLVQPGLSSVTPDGRGTIGRREILRKAREMESTYLKDPQNALKADQLGRIEEAFRQLQRRVTLQDLRPT